MSTLTDSNARKTHCTRGHPYSPENTYVSHSRGTPVRQCRKCRAARYQARFDSAGKGFAGPELEPSQIRRLKSDFEDGVSLKDLASRCGVHPTRLGVLLGVGRS